MVLYISIVIHYWLSALFVDPTLLKAIIALATDDWIQYNSGNVLWIPSDYIYNVICIGEQNRYRFNVRIKGVKMSH